ncbi:protein-glutamate methylesterase/protein-glutamine glutaminase [Rhodovulum sp. DZ06]|uniref:protein-glutamate methylesterase/protein-glutamine glutaminase n=1 Tax=Rhodovulum sp. DZ06 TaxID=3425126 RepID=UPI003D33598A
MNAPTRGAGPIRVLIVDDSASMRQALTRIVEADRRLEVMATAADPYVAADRMRREAPDVILLDLEPPRMDGVTFLRKLMAQRPTPVVICSSLAAEGSVPLIEALEAGAVDAIAKPQAGGTRSLEEQGAAIRQALVGAACARLGGAERRSGAERRGPAQHAPPEPKLRVERIIPTIPDGKLAGHVARIPPTPPVLCIGASTGGTDALQVLLRGMPADAPGMVIVQHMPEHFTATFARRLDAISAMTVREARDGDTLAPGLALLAPGALHMALRRYDRAYRVAVFDGPPISRHRPSVDVLFRSAAYAAGPNVGAAILTGMGDDGAEGMLDLHRCGARTLAQDEASCVVYGMPREALERGGAQRSIPLDRIAGALLSEAGRARAVAGR